MTAFKPAARKRGLDRISRDARKKIIKMRRDSLGDHAIASRMARSKYKLASVSYTDEEKFRVHTTLLGNSGNVKRTTRETGIVETTVRRWKEEFKTSPPQQTDGDQLPTVRTARDWLPIVEQVLEHAGLPAIEARPKNRMDSFWSRVDRVSSPTGCWLWTGQLDRKGYGKVFGAGAHRVAYEEIHGPLDGRHLHHICRTRNCVNPTHLVPIADASAHYRLERMEREFAAYVKSDAFIAEMAELRRAPVAT